MGVRNHIVCDAAPRPPALADTARVPGVSGGLKLAVALLASIGLALGCSGQAPSDPTGVPTSTSPTSEAPTTLESVPSTVRPEPDDHPTAPKTTLSAEAPAEPVPAVDATSADPPTDTDASALEATRPAPREDDQDAQKPEGERPDDDQDAQKPEGERPDDDASSRGGVWGRAWALADRSGAAAPQWPFRGLVQAFSVDLDGNDTEDLVLQYHDSKTRTTVEMKIHDVGGFGDDCATIRYDTDLLWFEHRQYEIQVPWGGAGTVRERPFRLGVTQARSPLATNLRMAGSRFTTDSTAERVRLIADDAESEYRVLHIQDETDSDSWAKLSAADWDLAYRGTDGELLALTVVPKQGYVCGSRLTGIISMRTGEIIACGRHSGDIKLITPPGEGLAVEHVVVPQGDVLDLSKCPMSLDQAPLDALSEDSLLEGLASLAGLSTTNPLRCPVKGLFETTSVLPSAPFYGFVFVDSYHHEICDRDVVTVQLHDSRSRETTLINIFDVEQLTCASHILPTEDGLELYVYQTSNLDGWIVTHHYQIELPWGQRGAWGYIAGQTGRPSNDHFSATPQMGWSDETVLGGMPIEVQSHSNGVRLVAGDAVAGYALSLAGSRRPPMQTALMGRHRLGDAYVSLEGTDGELVAFSWSASPADCTPKDVYVVSMRTGELVACGALFDGDVLLVAPEDGGLLVDEIVLPPSGWLDKRSCPNGIDDDLVKALEELPTAASSRAPGLPEPVPLPVSVAPDWPFHGVVRSYQRYDPAEFGHDMVVQYYRSDTSGSSEVVFGEAQLAGLVPDFFTAEFGVGVARDEASGDWVVIPWGQAPRLIAAQDAATDGWKRTPGARPRHPTSLPVDGAPLEIAGHEPWPVGVLSLSHGGTQQWYITSEPPESPPVEIEIELGEQGPAWTAHLRGTDGKTLALTYLHAYFDDCVSVCGLELTYLISLTSGEVLTCGVEPHYSEIAFVAPPDAPAEDGELILPPSGWLDPGPCLRGPPAGTQGCPILVHQHEPETLCVREFDLRAIPDGVDGASPIAASVTVRP